MISRKTFFKGLALGTISLPVAIRAFGGKSNAQEDSASSIINQKKYEWTMVTTWPPGFPVLQEGCELFAKLVKELSGGRMTIKVYGGGELVPALQAFDTVRDGAYEMGSGCAYYQAGKSAAAQFFASIPFGMNAQQLNAWLLCGGGMELWEELYREKFNLVPFLGGNTGVQMGGWFNREINTIADFKGLKMRMPGLGSRVLERVGGAPVLLAGGEIYTGLERNVIDATEWIGPYHDHKMGFHKIAKYYYGPGWHEPGTALEFFANQDKFDALPADLQGIIKTVSLQINHWMLSEFEAKNAEYLVKIQATDVEIRTYPPEVLEELKRVTDEIVEEMVAEDPFAKRVYESYDSFRNKSKAWAEFTEKAYYERIAI